MGIKSFPSRCLIEPLHAVRSVNDGNRSGIIKLSSGDQNTMGDGSAVRDVPLGDVPQGDDLQPADQASISTRWIMVSWCRTASHPVRQAASVRVACASWIADRARGARSLHLEAATPAIEVTPCPRRSPG